MKTWVMQCEAGDWQSKPFDIDAADQDFEAATEQMAQHVVGAHDGADAMQVVMRRTEDLEAQPMTFDDLPAMQRHLFRPWTVDGSVCQVCGQLPQAHPATQELADDASAAQPDGRDER